ncbi:MAG: glycosyltransferase family 4 protein [Gammaproteobacteria bacterium]|nr:glycosyltransferase family 4 protein [Gammaproteobacteria bacterium]
MTSVSGASGSLMACSHSDFDPASRFRVLQYLPRLEAAGWRVSHRPNRPWRHWRTGVRVWPLGGLIQRGGDALKRLSRWRDVLDSGGFDVVFVNRDLLGIDLVYEKALLARNPRVLFDFDDMIWLGARHAHVAWMCRHAAWVTAGNATLAGFARQYTSSVTLLPTVVDVSTYPPAVPGASSVPVRLGWLGSGFSIDQTLVPHLPMFAYLQRRLDFELVIVSAPRPRIDQPGLRWRWIPWSPRTETRIGELFDIGIMPLVDTPFQRGKCGTKLLQYMAAALPAIASPVGMNREIIGRSGAGMLAATTDEWRDAIMQLGDPAMRERLGLAGRAYCTEHYHLDRWTSVMLELLQRVADHRR